MRRLARCLLMVAASMPLALAGPAGGRLPVGPDVGDQDLMPFYVVLRLMSGSLKDGSPPPEHYLSEKGRTLLAAARTQCGLRGVADANAITMENGFSVPPGQVDALLGPVGAKQAFRARFPLMLGVGLVDELIPPARQIGAVRAMCRLGSTIAYKSYTGSRHHETLTRSTDDAVAFARMVITGTSVVSSCASLESDGAGVASTTGML